jgi:sugar diacid utilization regulator
MSDIKAGQEDQTERGSDPLSNVYDLLGLSSMMFDGRGREEIIRLATTFVSSMPGRDMRARFLTDVTSTSSDSLTDQLLALDGDDGQVHLTDGRLRWAFALRRGTKPTGYLVAETDRQLTDNEKPLLTALAQQTSAALADADHQLREREHAAELRKLTEEKAAVLTRLTSELQRQRMIHEVLARVSKSRDGEAGIARTLHGLTGLPVAVEDRFGNLRAWAGPDQPDPYPKADPRRRREALQQAASHGGAIRDRAKLFVLVQPRTDVIGVLALIDPGRVAGQHEVFALEHSAMALALELSHRQNLAEAELRLCRDLVDDLVSGTDEQSAYLRAEALGHDLHGVHHVLAVRWTTGANEDSLTRALMRAITQLDLSALVARRPGMAVALVRGHPPAVAMHRIVSQQMGNLAGAIGIGNKCEASSEFPRSFAEATRALDIRLRSRSPHGVTSFNELGVLRILHNEDETEIRTFVKEWLGELLDYDLRRRTDLVQTLSHYLDCGGNYDETAATLLIHRSTLRYRLQRIRDITGLDLTNVDNRLNLHVATRAWQVLEGSMVQPQ